MGRRKCKGGFVPEDRTILAKLSQASYKETHGNIGDWSLVHKSPNVALFVNSDGIPIISVRGTKPTSPADLYADSMIPLNKLKTTERYKQDYNTVKSWFQGKPFFAVGHSLGGAIIDDLIHDGLVAEAVTFNPAIQPKDVNAGVPNMRIYMKGDPLYTLFGQWDKNSIMVSKQTLAEGIRDALLNLTNLGFVVASVLSHKLTSFTGEGAKRKKRGTGEQKNKVLALKSQYGNRVVADVLKKMTDEVLAYIDGLNKWNKLEAGLKVVIFTGIIGSWFTPASIIAGIPATAVGIGVLNNIVDDELNRRAMKQEAVAELEATLKELVGLTPLQQRTWLMRREEAARRRLAGLKPHSKFSQIEKEIQEDRAMIAIPQEYRTNIQSMEPIKRGTKMVAYHALDQVVQQPTSNAGVPTTQLVDNGAVGHVPEELYERMRGQRDATGRVVGDVIMKYVGKGRKRKVRFSN